MFRDDVARYYAIISTGPTPCQRGVFTGYDAAVKWIGLVRRCTGGADRPRSPQGGPAHCGATPTSLAQQCAGGSCGPPGAIRGGLSCRLHCNIRSRRRARRTSTGVMVAGRSSVLRAITKRARSPVWPRGRSVRSRLSYRGYAETIEPLQTAEPKGSGERSRACGGDEDSRRSDRCDGHCARGDRGWRRHRSDCQ